MWTGSCSSSQMFLRRWESIAPLGGLWATGFKKDHCHANLSGMMVYPSFTHSGRLLTLVSWGGLGNWPESCSMTAVSSSSRAWRLEICLAPHGSLRIGALYCLAPILFLHPVLAPRSHIFPERSMCSRVTACLALASSSLHACLAGGFSTIKSFMAFCDIPHGFWMGEWDLLVHPWPQNDLECANSQSTARLGLSLAVLVHLVQWGGVLVADRGDWELLYLPASSWKQMNCTRHPLQAGRSEQSFLHVCK